MEEGRYNMLFAEELTQIKRRKEDTSPIKEVKSLIENEFPKLTYTLPDAYKSELRKWVSKDDIRYECSNTKNIIHLITDKENLHGDLAGANDDDVKVEINLKMPFHLFRKLLHNPNTWNLGEMLIFNTTYYSYPIKVIISDNTNLSNTFNTIIEFPIYAFQSYLEKEGFVLKKKEVTENGTKYDLIW